MVSNHIDPLNIKIGLLPLYWDFFNDIMPLDYQREKERLASEIVGLIGRYGEVVYRGLVLNQESAAGIAKEFKKEMIDLILVVPLMATPPSFPWACLKEFDIPMLLWNAHTISSIPDDFDMADLVRHSTNIGSLMLSNTLLREGRNFKVVTGYYKDEQTLRKIEDFLRVATAVSRLKKARLGVIGDVIPGYIDVSVDRKALQEQIGPECIEITEGELIDAFKGASSYEVDAVIEEANRTYAIADLKSEQFQRSARLSVALDKIAKSYRLDGGTVNCHTSLLLRNSEIGIVACYAVSRLTRIGIPFSCTGDIPTSIAMLILKALGGQSLYCECLMIDYEKDLMLISNCGQADPGIADPAQKPSLIENPQYCGMHGRGACFYFNCKLGKATLLSFSPRLNAKGGWVLVIASGEMVDVRYPKVKAPQASFRFDNGPTAKAFNRWCLGGATHHGVLTSGDYTKELKAIADMLGIEAFIV